MNGDPLVFTILGGAVLAAAYARLASRARVPERVYAAGLVVAACVYVVLALIAGNWNAALLEAGSVVVFGAVALLGVRFSSYFLAAGWTAHVAWDVLRHLFDAPGYAPWWYAVLCIGFDLVVAGAIVGRETGRG